MSGYLLTPEIGVLLAAAPGLKKRLFFDKLWNTDGRLNEISSLTDPGYVRLAGMAGYRTIGTRLCDIRSDDTARSGMN